MDGIITINDRQEIVLFNAAAERMFGWSAKESIGQSIDCLLPERLRSAHPEHDRMFGEKDFMSGTMGMAGALCGLRASGEEFPLEASISLLELSGERFYTVILRDVTERKRAEEELRESEARFRNMADTAPMMIWVAGTDKLRTYFNKLWLDFTGRRMEEEVDTGWAEGIHPDDYARVLEIYNSSFDRKEPFKMEYLLRRADGEYRWVLDSGAPRFSSQKDFLGYIGSCIDITDRRESEEELRRAHDELEQLKNQLEAENIYLQQELQLDQNFGEIVGQSDPIKYVLSKIAQVASTDATVLISGETGTGKELVARAIHGLGARKDRPLIKVNCAALSANLIESELFGHEKGAFTGAAARKLGRFELADRGTIFLDEIGELPLELQVKLLRVLQEGEFERVGGSRTITADVRIIAATNRNLKLEVDKGTFREDLWYRLNVFPITVPPLRQRKEDIPHLVDHLATKFAKRLGKTITSVSPRSLQRLQAHSWPGNVRELANVIERAAIHTQGSVLHLADSLEQAKEESPATMSLEELEREYIIRTLENTGWRVEGTYGAAKILGLNASTLRARMNKFGIQRPHAAAAKGLDGS
jgi:PAS domain S-box-containing protein